MASLASQFNLEHPSAIHRGVVERWLDTTDPEFVDMFIEYSKREDASKTYMFNFAREHGYQGGETSMKKYMHNIREGITTYRPLTFAK